MTTTNGILLITFLVCIASQFILLRGQAKRQKGLVLGVTLPPEADALPEVQDILRRYRRWLAGICLACALLGLPLMQVKEAGLFLTLWFFWFAAGLALPCLPFVWGNAKLKELKKAHGWQNGSCRIVDTAASAFSLPRPIGLWTLVPPLLLSLAPILLPNLPKGLIAACCIDAGCVLLFWAMGRWTFRRREDMVTADTTRNQSLLRVRRLYWDRYWRLGLWALAGLNFLLALGYRSEAAIMGGTLFFTLLLLGATLWMELRIRRAQAALTADTPIIADEDNAWLGGLLYDNPADRRFLVSKRIGLGSAVNLGTRAGKVYYAVVGLILALCLAIGPVLGILDSQPIRLELTGSAPACLVVSHGRHEKYALPVDRITDVQLRDTLPDAVRTFGIGMDHYLQGDFYVAGEGTAQFCLDPTRSCFLRVEVSGENGTEPVVYWFTAETEEQTEDFAQYLSSLRLRPSGSAADNTAPQ